ncbi:ABC transporter substrate-binding protein [Nocardioides bizhenqiangii]|uniref:ABC transporter substrate-binding protein n=1 Tax=Nocardioides bizhenqiangii TaxID=3095076 RepID=A0ABZ0ZRS5_9ACTN|nr:MULTISPECIES: ABC transporter substrate-binding protein [unclassified Nocardioides]MDZ5622655.1 ABC transporter substrate-binding protein [Nocardioides sp. HM23]WQQ26922.1 ABC transporter substrate-binding protein [Nocardioides sp. HM61]
MRIRRTITAALSASLVLAGLTACGDDDDGAGTAVTIASQNFPEAALVTELYTVLLEDNGYSVDAKLVDTRDAYMGDFPGDVDIVPEYLSAVGDFLNIAANGEDAEPVTSNDTDATLEAVTPIADEEGITLLEPSEANSQNAFFVTPEFSDAEGVTALSDLEGQSITLAAAPDCEGRPDCAGGLSEVYGIEIEEILATGFASPETYTAVTDGEAELGLTGTIEPTVEEDGFIRLEDDRGIQPAQNLIPAVSSDFLADNEDVEGLLNDLMAALDNDTLNELLGRVTLDREKAEDVAEDFLEQEGLI